MPTTQTTPTLGDVAREAGVSTATVSRCLNAPERVVESTRKRVLAAVDVLGYTPNFAARVMAAKRTFTIGAIIPTMENAIFARGLQAFQEELHQLGYTLLVASSAYKPEIEQEQIRALVSRGADGLLLIGHDREDAIYDYLERQNVPALAAWTYRNDARIPSIGFDNHDAMFALTEEVLALGHTNLAMISGIIQGNDRARLRLDGVRDALGKHGLDPASLAVSEVPYDIERGTEEFVRLMKRRNPPSVVLCGNDVLAAGALIGAQQMGLTVPDDVSITGFDDIELARIVAPALTTVHVPHREMGRKAGRALVDTVEKKGTVRSTCLKTSIKWRQSLGARVKA
ncbi:LacI family DNA-binding transcriptional regulator [Coralliovum pocilloporae]|uniref:LacI family DNA-binding transcriptional regulator n=1 Tax=Coralliovum pocilloporae TaxID=3066369 RepID=UPI0033076229